MAALNDRRYVVVDIGESRFGIPLARISNIMTLDEKQALQLAAENALDLRDGKLPRMFAPGMEQTPEPGNSILLVEGENGAVRILLAGSRVSSVTVGKLLAIPQLLQRIYPWFREAFIHEGRLVYCLSPETVPS